MSEEKKELRKQCSTCKDYKLLSDFQLERKKPLGVQSKCRLCKRAEGIARREKERTKDEITNPTNIS